MDAPNKTEEALLARAREIPHNRADFLQLANQLPTGDEDLARILGEAEAQRDETAFTRLWVASLLAERRPPASLLAKGAELFPDPILIAASIKRCGGDFASALIEAVQRGRMGNERVGFALLSAAIWLHQNQNGEYPRDLIREARKLARTSHSNHITHRLLRDFVLVTANREVAAILGFDPGESPPGGTFLESVAEIAERDPWRAIYGETQRKEVVLHSGYTMRRAVPKQGRNEPCPCGSGKKYKKCCLRKDEERLRHSSEIPGVTQQEIQKKPELFLTADRLCAMRAHELVKLNLRDIPKNLQPNLFNRLLLFNEFERMVEILQTHLEGEELKDWWVDVLYRASMEKRRDVMETLLNFNLVDAAEFDRKGIPLSAQLILARRRGEHVVELLEEHFKELLLREEHDSLYADWEGWAEDLMDSDYPALGIAVARGACVISESEDLINAIQEARDHLDLSPSDPIESMINLIPFPELRTVHYEDHNLRQAKEEIGEKSQQLDELKKELNQIRERLAQADAVKASTETQTAGAVAQPPQATAPSTANDAAHIELEQMRRRFKEVKEDLKARHRERNELRKELNVALSELEQSHVELESARQQEDHGSKDDEREEASLTSETFSGTEQPWRIPVYSPRFCGDLEKLPADVARHALQIVGDLAAGLPHAFEQVRKLKAAPSLLRARVGLYHRLLFSIQDKQIVLVAAIPRKDLEGFIKHWRR